jgi:hypothetical protein
MALADPCYSGHYDTPSGNIWCPDDEPTSSRGQGPGSRVG